MVRRSLGLLLVGLLAGPRLAAQANPRVSLLVSLHPEEDARGARKPQVQLRDLLADKRWSQALDQAFPIRLTFRLEIWKEGVIDEFQRATEWTTVIQPEPLQEQYRVTVLLRAGPQEYRFNTRDELARWIGLPNVVEAVPQGRGTFYYNVSLKIIALSDEDMEELERFLAGQPDTSREPERGSLGRSLRKFLLRVAGLPLEQLEARSSVFRVR
jgi:hypothetical protein